MDKEYVLNILNNIVSPGKILLDSYCEDNNKRKLTNEEFVSGTSIGLTDQAIHVALQYYMAKFNIVSLSKNGVILKFY